MNDSQTLSMLNFRLNTLCISDFMISPRIDTCTNLRDTLFVRPGQAESTSTYLHATMTAFVTPTLPTHFRISSRVLKIGHDRHQRSLVPLRRAQTPRATLETVQTLSTLSTTTQSLPALTLAASTPVLQFAKILAGPGINIFNFTMIVRIILSWYPKADLAKAPWIYVAVPTEPLLRATREVIKPVGGVDISPIVWFAIMSLIHELLVGPQGILVLLEMK